MKGTDWYAGMVVGEVYLVNEPTDWCAGMVVGEVYLVNEPTDWCAGMVVGEGNRLVCWDGSG